MSTLSVVADILREVAPRALCAREIAALAGSRLPTASLTPQTVVSRDLAIDVKAKGTASRFLRAAPGEFLLKEALPTAFYNDTDAYAAAWTRNLIQAGELAAGVVDERSIRDLKPADVGSYRQGHFFSGIGVWSRALREAGYPDDINVWSGSCPCQPISQAGRRRGFADDRHLWPEWFRLIAACRPSVVIGEQVSSKDGLAWLDLVLADLEGANYTVQTIDIPACSVGAPHRRQRLYFVAVARERADEVIGALRDARAVSDAAVARPSQSEDVRADRGDAITIAEAIERRPAGGLESERGRADDVTGAVPDAECIVWDEGWGPLSHGWEAIEPDRHGEVDGSRCGCVRTFELGDAGLARGGRDARAFLGEEGIGEGERIEARDLVDESLAPGAAHRPGDRLRLDGDPTWGGAVRGYWAEDVEWIYCRPEPGHEDGRWRPTRAGIEPLVAGIAPGMGRTRAKRLKGYGNAIVLPLATAFVAAVIDVLAGADVSVEDSGVVAGDDLPTACAEVA